VFLVAARLQSLLRAPALSHVQFKTGEPRHLAGRIAIGATQALYPQHGSVSAYEPVGVIPGILAARNLFERRMHPGPIVGVDPREPEPSAETESTERA